MSHDACAWGELYDRFVDRMYRYFSVRVGPGTQAEYLTERMFLEAWQQIDTFRSQERPFIAWLYDLARKARREHVCQPQTGLWLVRGQADALSSALHRLPPDEQEVLLLRFFERLGYEETAQVMNTGTDDVGALELRALKKLAGLMHSLERADSNRPGPE